MKLPETACQIVDGKLPLNPGAKRPPAVPHQDAGLPALPIGGVVGQLFHTGMMSGLGRRVFDRCIPSTTAETSWWRRFSLNDILHRCRCANCGQEAASACRPDAAILPCSLPARSYFEPTPPIGICSQRARILLGTGSRLKRSPALGGLGRVSDERRRRSVPLALTQMTSHPWSRKAVHLLVLREGLAASSIRQIQVDFNLPEEIFFRPAPAAPDAAPRWR